MASRDYGAHGAYGFDAREVDSGELWLPASPPVAARTAAQTKTGTRQRQREPRLSQGREKRAVRLLLLALPRLMDRETVWMSPEMRRLSPALRVKVIYELERLGAKLARM